MDSLAAIWFETLLRVSSAVDVTPTMHEIVVHLGDVYRKHGPILPYSSEGLEARHQPIKRTAAIHSNRRGAGASKTPAGATDIVQAAKRLCAADRAAHVIPLKGAKKKSYSKDSPLSQTLHDLQAQVRADLRL